MWLVSVYIHHFVPFTFSFYVDKKKKKRTKKKKKEKKKIYLKATFVCYNCTCLVKIEKERKPGIEIGSLFYK
jgi:hypothetical protein